ncbi:MULTISPECIES: response regulator transcription factor [Flavobacterium]|uniref:response regulator transcription factor n=1 Tax=Flavobacterium TaxID=237 RepID=UPI0009642786|nr:MULTISPECIES: response regulator transcription factor [Flavobacterium]MBN9282867.1 response regulator transcription factor [Flavobacterium sp.]OJV67510.1 MAG: DNA-binding response regulator [Flavobacterium sp. 40-81]
MIRVVIAEDHQSLIDGIKLSLEYEEDISVVGEANDGEVLIALVRAKRPDIVITDIRMPKCDGICATKTIKKEFPDIKVIAFSMFDQSEAVTQMKLAGASGYIMKNSSLKKLVEAIREVAKNNLFFDDAIMSKDTVTKEDIILSSREKEILRLIGEGKTSQEIADLLFIGKSTVDTHRKNILKKMSIQGKTDLIRFAVERKYDF